ncbi:unnamed protein product [Polarella glacialis]|uniref:CNNM transmembrane domain-containing protein n=1 Tax=Polarella glacialis TaxID=89957 RepID=A0A813HYS8_POLGL|nr:unnamed protein product [Polarella glacialis]
MAASGLCRPTRLRLMPVVVPAALALLGAAGGASAAPGPAGSLVIGTEDLLMVRNSLGRIGDELHLILRVLDQHLQEPGAAPPVRPTAFQAEGPRVTETTPEPGAPVQMPMEPFITELEARPTRGPTHTLPPLPPPPDTQLRVFMRAALAWGWTVGWYLFWAAIFGLDIGIGVGMQLFLESIGRKRGGTSIMSKKNLASAIAKQASAGGPAGAPIPAPSATPNTQRLSVLSQEELLASVLTEHWAKVAMGFGLAIAFRLPQYVLSEEGITFHMLFNLAVMLRCMSLVMLVIRDDMTLPKKEKACSFALIAGGFPSRKLASPTFCCGFAFGSLVPSKTGYSQALQHVRHRNYIILGLGSAAHRAHCRLVQAIGQQALLTGGRVLSIENNSLPALLTPIGRPAPPLSTWRPVPPVAQRQRVSASQPALALPLRQSALQRPAPALLRMVRAPALQGLVPVLQDQALTLLVQALLVQHLQLPPARREPALFQLVWLSAPAPTMQLLTVQAQAFRWRPTATGLQRALQLSVRFLARSACSLYGLDLMRDEDSLVDESQWWAVNGPHPADDASALAMAAALVPSRSQAALGSKLIPADLTEKCVEFLPRSFKLDIANLVCLGICPVGCRKPDPILGSAAAVWRERLALLQTDRGATKSNAARVCVDLRGSDSVYDSLTHDSPNLGEEISEKELVEGKITYRCECTDGFFDNGKTCERLDCGEKVDGLGTWIGSTLFNGEYTLRCPEGAFVWGGALQEVTLSCGPKGKWLSDPVCVNPQHEAVEQEMAAFEFWIDIGVVLLCVASAGLAAGLTLGLATIEPFGLSVIMATRLQDCKTPEEKEKLQQDQANAKRILPLVQDHHLLLVTLLLFNTVANETMPIFLDRLVPSWAAVMLSVSVVFICGEILPSAVFTGPRQFDIAAAFVPFVQLLEVFFFAVAKPLASVLDHMIKNQAPDSEKNAGAKYSRAELRALISLHGPDEPREESDKEGSVSQEEHGFGSHGHEDRSILSAAELRLLEGALRLGGMQVWQADYTKIPRCWVASAQEPVIDVIARLALLKRGHKAVLVLKDGSMGCAEQEDVRGSDAQRMPSSPTLKVRANEVAGCLQLQDLIHGGLLPLGELCLKPLVLVPDDCTLLEALQKLREAGSSSAVVVHDSWDRNAGIVRGIISVSEVLGLLVGPCRVRQSPSLLTVAGLLQSPPISPSEVLQGIASPATGSMMPSYLKRVKRTGSQVVDVAVQIQRSVSQSALAFKSSQSHPALFVHDDSSRPLRAPRGYLPVPAEVIAQRLSPTQP